jgi:GNAT superfamily N-acetyltransferase
MPENAGGPRGPMTGWEVETHSNDTALRQFIDAQIEFQRLAGAALGARVVVTDRFAAVDTGRPATFVNFALLRKPLEGDELERTMAELEEIYGAPGATGSAAIYSPLPSPSLSRWGWELSGHPPLQLRSPYTPTIDTSTIRVEPVASDEDLDTFERIMIEGFEMEEMRGAAPGSLFRPSMLEDSRFRAWLGYLGDEPAGGAASMTHAGIVDVVMVATLPQARRKGIGLAVTQAAARPKLGLPAALYSSDEGRPIYERLGFVPLLRGSFWHRER